MVERLRSVEEEAREILGNIEEMAKESIVGNPIPALIPAILSLIVKYGIPIILAGIGIWWIHSYFVAPTGQAVQQWSPIIGAGISMLMFVMSFLPFFMMFSMVMSLLR